MTGNTDPMTKTAARKRAAQSKKRPAKTATTTHKLIWRDIACHVRHTPDCLSKGWSHIEIIVLKPKGAPLPITETGYRSHFLGHDELERAGGAVRFFLDWIDREAASRQWSKAEFKWRQATCSHDITEGRLNGRTPLVQGLTATSESSPKLTAHVLAMYSQGPRPQKSSGEAELQASDCI